MPDTTPPVAVCMTWQPADAPGPETLTVLLPPERITEMQELIGTEAWARSETVMWMPAATSNDGPFVDGLFRLARITHIEEQPRA